MTAAHYLSMTIIGIGSFLFGILPIGVSFRVTRSCPLFLSLILCFGAGVLLSTSLVHMLTEVQTKLKLSSQIYFCAGFLILYTFDEISHFCLGSSKPEPQSAPESDSFQDKGRSKVSNYGTIPESSSGSMVGESNVNMRKPGSDNVGCNPSQLEFRHVENDNERVSQHGLLCAPSHSAHHHHHHHHHHQDRCHVEISEPCSSTHVAKSGLLIALLIHSILEGISIGVQTEMAQILLILGAVSFHKFVLSFCLGLELHSYGYKRSHFLIAIFLFSIGSPVGILVGMTVTSFESGIFSVDAQLQAMAAGSLLYVAAFEVLPRERFKWQHEGNRKAGIFQLIFLIIGFMSITTFHLYIVPSHDEENKQIPSNSTRKLCW